MAKNQSGVSAVLKAVDIFHEQNVELPSSLTLNPKTFAEVHSAYTAPQNKTDNRLKHVVDNLVRIHVDSSVEKPVCN